MEQLLSATLEVAWPRVSSKKKSFWVILQGKRGCYEKTRVSMTRVKSAAPVPVLKQGAGKKDSLTALRRGQLLHSITRLGCHRREIGCGILFPLCSYGGVLFTDLLVWVGVPFCPSCVQVRGRVVKRKRVPSSGSREYHLLGQACVIQLLVGVWGASIQYYN